MAETFSLMTLDEVMQTITQEPKFYIGVIPQSTAADIKRRWKNGTLKQSTALEFIKKFGYDIAQEATYKKVNN